MKNPIRRLLAAFVVTGALGVSLAPMVHADSNANQAAATDTATTATTATLPALPDTATEVYNSFVDVIMAAPAVSWAMCLTIAAIIAPRAKQRRLRYQATMTPAKMMSRTLVLKHPTTPHIDTSPCATVKMGITSYNVTDDDIRALLDEDEGCLAWDVDDDAAFQSLLDKQRVDAG